MKKMETLGRFTLSSIYGILIYCCGASEEDRDQFIRYVLIWDENRALEWRFQGSLGFGGKIWLYNSDVPYVNYYPEDKTEARDLAVKKANAELVALFGPGV